MDKHLQSSMSEAERRERSPEFQMWIAESVTSNTGRYIQLFRDLIETLPEEKGLRLYKSHLLKDPRYAGTCIDEQMIMREYRRLKEEIIGIKNGIPGWFFD